MDQEFQDVTNIDFDVPKRVYATGKRKTVSWRLPEKLVKQLQLVSKERGWNVSDVVITILDQALQTLDKKKQDEVNNI